MKQRDAEYVPQLKSFRSAATPRLLTLACITQNAHILTLHVFTIQRLYYITCLPNCQYYVLKKNINKYY